MRDKISVNQIIVFGTLLLLSIMVSCSSNQQVSPNQNTTNSDTVSKPVAIQKPNTVYSDTITIDKASAVFFNPDSVQVDQFKKIVSNNMFESMQHDCFFQQRNARINLKKYWKQIQIVEATHCRFLKFVFENKTSYVVDLDKTGDMCGIFLFNRKKAPQIVDMMTIETGVDYYFNQ